MLAHSPLSRIAAGSCLTLFSFIEVWLKRDVGQGWKLSHKLRGDMGTAGQQVLLMGAPGRSSGLEDVWLM